MYKNPILYKFNSEDLLNTPDLYLKFQDPTILGFKLMFNFNSGYGLLSESMGDFDNTALAYLKRIGQNTRVEYLKKFIELLRNINQKTPWYFQTIEGLGDLWNRDIKEFYKEDRSIGIGCLESIDMRITAMMDFYRKACFDWHHKREVVPANLRKFELMIYVYDWRIFNDFSNDNTKFGSIKRLEQSQLFGSTRFEYDSSDDLNIGATTSRQIFKLTDCEFQANESNAHLESVSNPEANIIAQKIQIKFHDFEESNVYNMFLQGKVSDVLIKALDSAAIDNQIEISSDFNPLTEPEEQKPSIPEALKVRIENLPENTINAVANIPSTNLFPFLNNDIGLTLLDNTTIFQDSSSLLNITQGISDIELNGETGNTETIEDFEDGNSVLNTSDDISVSIDSITTNPLNSIELELEPPIINNEFNVEKLESVSLEDTDIILDLEGVSNNSEVLNLLNTEANILGDSIQFSLEPIDVLNNDIEFSLKESSITNDDIDLDLEESIFIADEISVSLEESVSIEDIVDLDLNPAIVNEDLVEDLDNTIQNESVLLDVEIGSVSIEDSIDEIDPTSITSSNDDIDLNLTESISNDILNDFDILPPEQLESRLEFKLEGLESKLDGIKDLEQPNLTTNDINFNLDVLTIKNEDINLNLKSVSITNDSLKSINVVEQGSNNIDFSIETAPSEIRTLTDFDNLEQPKESLNILNFNMSNIDLKTESVSLELNKAPHNLEILSNEGLPEYKSNTLNPQKDCNDETT